MNLSLHILLDQLRDLPLEVHVPQPETASFSRAALLPLNYTVMQKDLIHVCRLSDALRAASVLPGRYYLCIRDRFADGAETEAALSGMVIIQENLDVALLLSRVQEIFNRISEWYRMMLEALVREESLQRIVDLSENVLGNTINISDSAFTLLARTRHIETDDPVSNTLAEFGYHPESTLQLFRTYHRFGVWETAPSLLVNDSLTISKYVLVNKVFRFQNTYFTHVVMVCDHHPLTDGLLELFQILTKILAVYAERNWKDKNSLSHNYDAFLFDLLSGTLTNPADISERAQYLGMRTEGRLQVLKVALEPGMETALGRVGRELTELLPGTQVVLYDHAVLALVHLRGERGGIGIPEEHMEHFLVRHHARGGSSNAFSGLENLPAAYDQAALALKYSWKRHAVGTQEDEAGAALCTFQDQALYGLLGEHPDNVRIWRDSRYYAGLRTLADYDQLHGTDNLQLLRVYLCHERKATETGAQLHMHRNNVIYRIGRMESLMELDLNDGMTRLGLAMSFLLLELYGFPPTGEEAPG